MQFGLGHRVHHPGHGRENDATTGQGSFHHGIQFTDMNPHKFAALRRLIKAQTPVTQ